MESSARKVELLRGLVDEISHVSGALYATSAAGRSVATGAIRPYSPPQSLAGDRRVGVAVQLAHETPAVLMAELKRDHVRRQLNGSADGS